MFQRLMITCYILWRCHGNLETSTDTAIVRNHPNPLAKVIALSSPLRAAQNGDLDENDHTTTPAGPHALSTSDFLLSHLSRDNDHNQ